MDTSLDRPREACGVVGIYAPGAEVARSVSIGLSALQHRGQESAGIAVSEGDTIVVNKEMGLVSQVFDERSLQSLQGHLAIGHVRYSTTGSSSWENAQPLYRNYEGLSVALGHNGNLVNTMNLEADLANTPGRRRSKSTSDSDLIAELIVRSAKDSVEEAILEVMPKLRGAFTLTLMDENNVFGVRDPWGIRPLVLGRIAEGYVLASESCALGPMGAELIREVEPGEMIAIDAQGYRSIRFADPTPASCIFEFVYFSRPDSMMMGKGVQGVRYRMGQRLASEQPAQADVVMPVPDSGRGAAAGYAAASGISFGEGFVRNSYVGRTFIRPHSREEAVRAKLSPLIEMVEGKRLVVVEDSIVRGITTKTIVKMLRQAGATEVHMRISSPPIKWPAFYGIDTPDRQDLIAASRTVEEVCEVIGADSLGYLSLEGMVDATGVPSDKFCTACFSGDYPIEIPDEMKLSKHMLEDPVITGGSS